VEEETKRKIQAIVDKIVREYKPEKIILSVLTRGASRTKTAILIFLSSKTDDPMLKRMEDVDKLFSRGSSRWIYWFIPRNRWTREKNARPVYN